jgi:hypothetical protein
LTISLKTRNLSLVATEIIKKRGKSYRDTVLDMMMYYPTIFPSENAAAQHLFLCYGTAYEWNGQGQLVYTGFGEKKRKIGRTKESITGGGIKISFFLPCGYGPTLWTNDIADEYSPIMHVLRGEVTPAEDWMNGLRELCQGVLRPDKKLYIDFLKTYTKMTGQYKEWFPRYSANYLKLRKIAIQILKK